MNLPSKLLARQQDGKPLRNDLISAGKFGSMFLAQMLKVPSIHLVAVVDPSPAAAIWNAAALRRFAQCGPSLPGGT